jgi:hypothetical protein
LQRISHTNSAILYYVTISNYVSNQARVITGVSKKARVITEISKKVSKQARVITERKVGKYLG